MQASVIIPVYNDSARLKRCLDALAEQTYPREKFEVIVVDNGSEEPPKELVESYAFCRFTEESRPGSYAARNQGLSLAKNELLVFTDSDCLPDPHWLEEGIKLLEADPNLAIIAGSIVVFAKQNERPTAAELYDIAFGLPQEETVKNSGKVMTANLFTRRSIFDLVGVFDASLMSYGDQEWSSRVVNQGLPVIYSEKAIIEHPARYSIADLVRQMRRHLGGKMDRSDELKQKERQHSGLKRLVYLASRWILPDFRKMLEAKKKLSSRGFGFMSWIKTIGVILWLQYSGLFEYLRKQFGAKSERL